MKLPSDLFIKQNKYFSSWLGAIQKYCHAQAYLCVQYHVCELSNGILYDILSQGVLDLQKVKVKTSKKGYLY